MAKDRLEEMRQKLKLDGLEESKKKDMFNKFVQAGGKVVDLNKGDRKTKDGRTIKPVESHAVPIDAVEPKKKVKNKAVKTGYAIGNQKDNPVNKWIERFSARMGCVFSGILTWNGDNLKNGFKELILNDYQNSLLNSRMILASILYQDKVVANEIKRRFLFDTVFPYYFELLFRFDNLFEDEFFNELLVIRHVSGDDREAKALLKRAFKSVFVLQPYYYSLKTGLEKALQMEKEIRNMDSKIILENLKKLNTFVDFVFTRVYPKLFALIDYYYKCDTKLKVMSFKDYLGIDDSETIGYLTNLWKEELILSSKRESAPAKDSKNPAQEVKQQEDTSPGANILQMDDEDPIKKGLKLIEKNVKFRDILMYYYEKKDPRALFSIKDKVFLTYALVDFFDKEFSFIFTSNKVEFNVVFLEGNRADMRKDLAAIYYRLTNIFERSNEYLKIIREIRKLENDAYLTIQERSARSNQYSLQRSQISRTMRKEAKEFFDEFSKKFLIIISDYHTEKKVIQNAEALLEFDKKISGERYTDKKRVIDAVDDAYNYTCALNFLLIDGDLGGYSLLDEKPVYLSLNTDDLA